MLDSPAFPAAFAEAHANASPPWHAPGPTGPGDAPGIERLLEASAVLRRRVHARRRLFHAGQPCRALFLVHAGVFKTCMLSEDGRERVTGFHLRGDLLGIESFDLPSHACNAIALDTCEVLELPLWWLKAEGRDLLPHVAAMLSAGIRRDWQWMLTTGTLGADQRVAAFLLDLAARLHALGYSARRLLLRMTRADLGSFLDLQLETVTRALSRLADTGLIVVERREILIRDEAGLRSILAHA